MMASPHERPLMSDGSVTREGLTAEQAIDRIEAALPPRPHDRRLHARGAVYDARFEPSDVIGRLTSVPNLTRETRAVVRFSNGGKHAADDRIAASAASRWSFSWLIPATPPTTRRQRGRSCAAWYPRAPCASWRARPTRTTGSARSSTRSACPRASNPQKTRYWHSGRTPTACPLPAASPDFGPALLGSG